MAGLYAPGPYPITGRARNARSPATQSLNRPPMLRSSTVVVVVSSLATTVLGTNATASTPEINRSATARLRFPGVSRANVRGTIVSATMVVSMPPRDPVSVWPDSAAEAGNVRSSHLWIGRYGTGHHQHGQKQQANDDAGAD